jgi:predicted nucleic acid-binding protein
MLLVERYFLSHSLEMNDALIAATTLELGETLLTANDKHYRFIPGIKIDVFRPL